MNKWLFLTCILLFCFLDNTNVYAFTKEEKEAKLEQVFNRLLNAMGFNECDIPQVNFSSSNDCNGAGIKYINTRNAIEIDACLWRILETENLLEPGLAIFLGHELGHYEKEGTFNENFSVVPLDIFQLEDHLLCGNDRKDEELFCDYYGLFAAYRAGYQPFGVATKIIRAFYEKYEHNKKSDKYYPLHTRLSAVKTTEKKVKELIRAFETANKLNIIGAYELSESIYDYIQTSFHSREILNNLASLHLYQTLNHADLRYQRFIYPIQIDNLTRLSKGVRDPSQVDPILFEKHLNLAIQYLESIIEKDGNYTIALTNLSIAYLLKTSLNDDSILLAEEYFNESKNSLLSNNLEKNYTETIQFLEALLSFFKGDISQAKNILSNLSQEGASLEIQKMATCNLAKMNREGCEIINQNSNRSIINENYCNLNLYDYSCDENNSELIHLFGQQKIILCENENSPILICQGPENTVKLQLLSNKCSTQDGISIGRSAANLKATYQSPNQLIPLHKGTAWLYTNRNICFILDDNDQIVESFAYQFQ